MPKTISVANTPEIISCYSFNNQLFKLKKKIPARGGAGILIYRFSFRVSDYFVLVCNSSVQANIEDIFEIPNLH